MSVLQRVVESPPGIRWHWGRLWTRLVLRRTFAHLGDGTVLVSPRVLRGVDRISIGDDCAIYEGVWLQCEDGGRITIGDHTYLGHGVHVHSGDPVHIGGGCVLATSSVTGNRVAYPGLSHYAASKAGVNGFIRNAALELAPRNIRVNGVEPGMIHTPAMANLGDAALEARIAAGIPLGRLGQPADIANAMLFLASDAAAYITGQTLVVDGGKFLNAGV